MTPGLFRNWLLSIEHQYGRRKCSALASNLVHRALITNVSQLKPNDIIDIHRVVDAFAIKYEGGEIPMPTFQWLLDFYQMLDYEPQESTVQNNIMMATYYLLREMLGIPTEGNTPAWASSIVFSMATLSYRSNQMMRLGEEFLEHCE